MSDYDILFILGLIIYLLIKNFNTFNMRCKISRAICEYRINNGIRYNCYIDYDCMETYGKTLLRLWDWGYKRIVNKYVYDEIKQYIK